MGANFDFSRKAQVSFVFRYISKNINIICKRLTTSLHFYACSMFESVYQEISLNWKDYLIGKSYDGAASMKNVYKDLQSYVKHKIHVQRTYGVVSIV